MGAPAHAGESTTDRRNNFDVIRLGAALLVLFSHAFVLSDAQEPVVGMITFGQLGVLVFFGVSGHLIAQSWAADSRLSAFLAKRALRIFPALIVVAFVTAFVIGPLVSSDGARAYFGSADALGYAVSNSLTFLDDDLPGVFTTNPIPTVNGSLWTLHFEALSYLVVAAAGVAAARRGGRMASTIAFAAMLLVGLGFSVDDASLGGNTVVAAFAVGALLFLWADVVPRSPLGAAFAMLAFVAAGSSGVGGLELLVGPFAVAYAAIVFAYATPPGWSERLRGHDLSYGLYLWGFLLQQLIVWWFPAIDAPTLLLLSLMVTVPVAALSWFLVERPALRLKHRFVGARPLASPACSTPTLPSPSLASSPSR